MLRLWAITVALLGADEDLRQADAILNSQSEPPTVNSLVEIITRRILHSEDRITLIRHLARLRDDRFNIREHATIALLKSGSKAKGLAENALRDAEAAEDSEGIERIRFLLQQWEHTDDSRIIWAAAIKLKTLPPQSPSKSDTSRRLLIALPSIKSRFLQAPVREAAWLHAVPTDLTWLHSKRNDSDAIQKATAICLIAKLDQDFDVAAFTEHPSVEMRLAAARVLAQHNRPGALDAAPRLVKLLGHERHDIRAEARYLLRALRAAAEPRAESDASTISVSATMLASEWGEWVKANRDKITPLASIVAFRWGVLNIGLREDFDTEVADLKSYGAMQYASSVPAKAAVKAGMLYLSGGAEEGDQGLTISAPSLVSAPEMQAPFVVKSAIGGELGNNVGWHVGVSVGRVKILFHPAYSGGAFRVEDVQTHQYITPNVTMPFTPQAGIVYPMRVHVRPTPHGGAKLEIEVGDAKSDKRFNTQLSVTREQMGPIDRVGLHRSGRAGGAAMFDFFEVRSEQ